MKAMNCKKCTILLVFSYVLLPLLLFGQAPYDPNHAPNTFRNADNPLYWKNRPPFPGYWQQDVYYKIKAAVDDSSNIINGSLQLTYWNNSPDTLTYVYFHLYQNAFQPGSYWDNIIRNNGGYPRWGKYETNKQGTVIESLKTGNENISYESNVESDNTILKVFLKKPLLPGNETQFFIAFKTYFDSGSERRRMKLFNASGFKHYDGVHWYPRISVYDKKFGWDTYQHLGREFYGDYGTYDVELTFPNHYIVDATGTLQNKNEVMPDSLRKKIDIKNFALKPYNSQASMAVIPDGSFKTWKFYAENVHDFAWTADPTYRIGTAYWNGIECIALAQESHAAGWQNAAEYAAKVIETFSRDIGMYAYPKIIVADARDGMEYPMLTLDGGYDPVYRGLFVHEIGHNWFFGMVGNNETYRAILDEGFSQFLTAWGLEKIDGVMGEPQVFSNKYQQKFSVDYDARYDEVYYPYLLSALKNEDGFINTHSDMFIGPGGHNDGYRQVYRKTATMLYNLMYVLGDSLFLHSMQHYFDQWKFCHPYPEDFRQSMISFTKVDLNWFFDQWLETDKRIDYKISCIKKTQEPDVFKIKFKRKEQMQMPIDFSVYSKTGIKHDFHIPNTWFVKETEATVLPKWMGWNLLHPTYTATVKIEGGIDDVVIDTSQRLGDINMLNNRKKFASTLKFDSRISNWADRNNYEMFVRPDLWYNSYDGFKTGLHLEGSYMNYLHVFSFDTWVNTGIAQGYFERPVDVTEFDPFSVLVRYRTPVRKLFKNTFVNLSAKLLDGLNEYKGGLEFISNSKKTKVVSEFKSMYRKNTNDLEYLLYPGEWQSSLYNNTLKAGVEHHYKWKRINTLVNLAVISSSVGSDYDYSKIILNHTSRTAIGKFDLHFRLFAQYGTGNFVANESALFLAGANPEELMDEKFTRSRGLVPFEWAGYSTSTNNFQQGGGLNLRGYAGYLVPENNNGEITYAYKGTSGAALNIEIDFDRLFRFAPSFTSKWLKCEPYFFADAGVINKNRVDENLSFSSLRADAGIGTAFTIKKFGPLEKVNPFTIRFDMPLVLNRPPFEEKDYFKFRWMLGISRCF